jgi:glycosyltransferase involved in cell wall biosynthesis
MLDAVSSSDGEPFSGKRVAIFSHSHPSITKGGAEIAARTLFRGLRESGIDAILICTCEDEALERIELDAYEFAIPYQAARYDSFYHIAPINVREAFVALLRRERIDLLNAHHFLNVGSGIFADAADAGIDVVFTIHEFLSICHNHGQLVTRHANALCDGPSPSACRGCYPAHTRQQFAVRAQHFADALRPVAAFVSPSRFLADTMIRNGFPADRMHIIDNGVEHHGGHVTDPPARRRPTTFGYFGQINPFKGLDVLLDACDLIARGDKLSSRLRIVVHGNIVGQSNAFIERFTAACSDHPFLRYAGPYDNTRVQQLMSGCDYVVFPSTWYENSPVVIQEAFLARLPVICTGIGGMAEKVVDQVNGLHFARGDGGDLADRMSEATDPEVRARLQQNIPEVLSPVQMASRYCAVFDEVVASKASFRENDGARV